MIVMGKKKNGSRCICNRHLKSEWHLQIVTETYLDWAFSGQSTNTNSIPPFFLTLCALVNFHCKCIQYLVRTVFFALFWLNFSSPNVVEFISGGNNLKYREALFSLCLVSVQISTWMSSTKIHEYELIKKVNNVDVFRAIEFSVRIKRQNFVCINLSFNMIVWLRTQLSETQVGKQKTNDFSFFRSSQIIYYRLFHFTVHFSMCSWNARSIKPKHNESPIKISADGFHVTKHNNQVIVSIEIQFDEKANGE